MGGWKGARNGGAWTAPRSYFDGAQHERPRTWGRRPRGTPLPGNGFKPWADFKPTLGDRNDGKLGVGEGFGVLDEVGGLLDEALDGVGGFTEADVEAVAVKDITPCGVVSKQAADLGVVLSEPEEGAGGVGGLGREMAGAGED